MITFIVCLTPFIYLIELIFLLLLINKNKEIEKLRQRLIDEYIRVAELLETNQKDD